jgi:hypothetical protein
MRSGLAGNSAAWLADIPLSTIKLSTIKLITSEITGQVFKRAIINKN